MPYSFLASRMLLPELKLDRYRFKQKPNLLTIWAHKSANREYCPKCATSSQSTYDHRVVTIKDEPMRGVRVRLLITKRRLMCKTCKKPFTEPLKGIRRGHKTSNRFKEWVFDACKKYANISAVRKTARCSASFVYKIVYDKLLHHRKAYAYPWPTTIGIDEHYFKRGKFGHRQFVTVITDFKKKRLFDMTKGISHGELRAGLDSHKRRERVKTVVIDLSGNFRSFVKNYFPKSQIVADKFHVLKLLNPQISAALREIKEKQKTSVSRLLLLKPYERLSLENKIKLDNFIVLHPKLWLIWGAKESLRMVYQEEKYSLAKKKLQLLIDRLSGVPYKEIKTFRRTLITWYKEILAYFETKLTNGPTEGFNNKAKVIKRQAYGYRSFENYRLRVLNACF